MEIQDHFNVKELMAFAIEKFNALISDGNAEAIYRLDDDPDKFEANYSLYIARKNGEAKDDFPGKHIHLLH